MMKIKVGFYMTDYGVVFSDLSGFCVRNGYALIKEVEIDLGDFDASALTDASVSGAKKIQIEKARATLLALENKNA